jgi:NADPH:quinone reductase-like Zn-dependent oxidoreductase
MKAVQFDVNGGPEVLHVAEVEEPHAGPGQIRVAVRAVGINPVDFKIRSGMFGPSKTLPVTTALDASGVVDEVGDGVEGVAVGDEVFGQATGGAAGEFAVLTHWARKPATMSFEEAAGLPRRPSGPFAPSGSSPETPCWSTAPQEASAPPPYSWRSRPARAR